MNSQVLVLGASYGLLLATKLLLAGHSAHLICHAPEAELINTEGTVVRLRPKGAAGTVDVASKRLPGTLTASDPTSVDPARFDLVVLAMQEPQYAAPGVRELLARVGASGLPVLAIMNMPPLPYLARLPGVDLESCRGCYTDASVWDGFDPALVTMCSADPQAFRPAQEKPNVLQVGLPTNFKAARFSSDSHTALLRRLEQDIETARYAHDGASVELPVKLKVHDSTFVPLAKWPMLITGNYRCVMADAVRPIREAVHSDKDSSRELYQWVSNLCLTLGASEGDLVSFDKYAAAASDLTNPSSVARAVHNGARHIERVDRLVNTLARQRDLTSEALERIVATVDARLEANRRQT